MSTEGSDRTVVLVVDDDEELRELTTEVLSGLGLRVISAANAADALRLLEADDAVGLLFTDIRMPGMHGFELARRARALRPHLKIIYATGHAGLPSHEIGPLLGPLIRKPWHRRELVDEIKKATGV
jgi:CheY-like chemotaxis protein